MQRHNFARERSSRGRAVTVTGSGLGILATLTLLRPVDGRTFWIGSCALLAGGAYRLLGPAMSTTLGQFSQWLTPRR